MSRSRLEVWLLGGWSVLAGAAGIGLANWIFQPVPIPLGAAVIFGLAAWWITRRAGATLISAVIGLCVGMCVHGTSHVLEGRVPSPPQFLLHVLADAAISACAAGVILGIALLPTRAAAAPGRGGRK